MQTFTKYRAEDGTEFDSYVECHAYQYICKAIHKAMLPLGEQPQLKSGEYVQRERTTCLQVKRDLIAIAVSKYAPETYPVFKHPPDDIHPCSAAGRIITDSNGPLAKAWERLMCIDWTHYREYDQPFYARKGEEQTCQPN